MSLLDDIRDNGSPGYCPSPFSDVCSSPGYALPGMGDAVFDEGHEARMQELLARGIILSKTVSFGRATPVAQHSY